MIVKLLNMIKIALVNLIEVKSSVLIPILSVKCSVLLFYIALCDTHIIRIICMLGVSDSLNSTVPETAFISPPLWKMSSQASYLIASGFRTP